MKRIVSFFVIAAAAAGLMGCESDYDIDVRFISDAPADVIVDGREIRIDEGVAVGVEIIAIEDDEIEDYDVQLIPARGGIIGIDGGLEEENHIIYGINAGATEVDVFFDDERVFEIRAIVSAQD